MTEEHSTILDAVQNINADLYKQLGDDTTYVLSVILEPTAGYQYCEWMGDTIWHSEDDNREYIDAYDEFKGDNEELEPYLRKQIMTLLSKLQQIQL